MKTKWCLYILWSVLSLGLLSGAESPFTRTRKRFIKLGTPKSKATKQSSKSSQRFLPANSPPAAQIISRSPPLTPRSMRPEPKVQSGFAYLPDVSVTCSTSDLVVRVKPSFYGLGAAAEELKLGSNCRSNGVLRPYGDLLFTYPLTACDVVREAPRGYLIYKFQLHYEPSPKSFPSRTQRINVDIECRYQRKHHVYQLTVKPTWETAVVRKRLKGSPDEFLMELMDDSWSRPAKSEVYLLGKPVNFQVSAPRLPTGGKLYISTCYAAPSSDTESSLKYTIIDNFGCMLDSRSDPGASHFISRTDNTLRFSLKAFHFTSDPDTEVNIHCKLFVTSEDPGPAHKSCTYRGNRWKALTGDDSVCECCDSQCVTSKPRRAMMEGSASSRSLLVSDQPAEDDFLPVSTSREATVNHSQEKLWDTEDVGTYDDEDDEEEQDYADEEEEEELEEDEEEPDFDELGFREEEPEVKDSDELEEDGSGYVAIEESEEEEEEEGGFDGGEDEIYVNQKEAEVVRHWVQLEQMFPPAVGLQRELQPLVSEEEEGNRKHAGGDEEDDEDDEDDEGEKTWYFRWR